MDLPALEPYLIKDGPESMFYVANFISEEEEAYILNEIPANRWISLTHRRLQAIPARLTATNALIASTGLPDWLLKPIVERMNGFDIFKGAPHGINHCLINEYHPGQGIMPHEDGAAYYPIVATVSLGGTIMLDVTEKSKREAPIPGPTDGGDERRSSWRILQEPRSLLITVGSAYKDTLHGIADVKEDSELDEGTVANWSLLGDRNSIVANGGRSQRTTRISLTFRDVLKQSNVGSKIFGKGRN